MRKQLRNFGTINAQQIRKRYIHSVNTYSTQHYRQYSTIFGCGERETKPATLFLTRFLAMLTPSEGWHG